LSQWHLHVGRPGCVLCYSRHLARTFPMINEPHFPSEFSVQGVSPEGPTPNTPEDSLD